MTLKFSLGNQKLNALAVELGYKKNQVVGFDLPAGWTCPCASLCLSKADPVTGKITDGKDCLFRCYASSGEAVFKQTRFARWHNYNALKGLSVDEMVSLINDSLPKNVKVVRIHASGDFYNRSYFNAWVKVAEINPEIVFFGYTKVLPYVKAVKPDNFKLVYSWGGKMDSKHTNEPVCRVVSTVDEAKALDLPVSCDVNEVDDFYRIIGQESFSLLIHGTQPKKKV